MSARLEAIERATREAASEREHILRKLVGRFGPGEHARSIGRSLAELRARLVARDEPGS